MAVGGSPEPPFSRQPPTANRQLNLRTAFWIAAAALSAWACHLAVHHATPIDRALPFLAVAVTLAAALSYPWVMVGVVLLVVAELAVFGETARLLAFGAIVAGAFATAIGAPASSRPVRWLPAGTGRQDAGGPAGWKPALHAPLLTLTAVFLLRWIPFSGVLIGRELFLLAIAVAIVFVLGRTPFAIATGVVTALVTPAVPLRTLALPLIVLAVAVLARAFGMNKVALRWPSAAILAFVLLFFPWSGIVARAFPYFLKPASPEVQRHPGAPALPANATVTLDVPDGAKAVVVSGANVARLERGTILGRMNGLPIRIGDAADWGYLRRDHFYGSRNPLPRNPAGRIRGYGYTAWVDGAGRMALPPNARTITITADAALPAGASLQVEGFE